MKSLLLCTLVIFISLPSFAQKKMRAKRPFGRTHMEAGLTISSSGDNTILSPSALQYWSFGEKNRKFKFGIGARYSASIADNNPRYITAPARLTSERVGPAVLFTDNNYDNVDTLAIEGTSVHAFNLMLALRYDIDKNFGLEFNIDLLGFTLGRKQEAILTYDDGKSLLTNAYPTAGNVLLISDNDIGNLNSEFMISYKHKKHLRFKVGGVFFFNEYDISRPVTYVNNAGTVIDAERYRNKTLQLAVGFNYIFNYFLNKPYLN